jgi:hypothetical protein
MKLSKTSVHRQLLPIGALADKLGVHRNTLGVALAASPAHRNGPAKCFTLAVAREALARHLRGSPRDPARQAQRERYLDLKVELLRLQIDAAKGDMVKREDVANALTALCATASARIRSKLAIEWPAALAGADEAAMRAETIKLHDHVVAAFRQFAEKWGQVK